MCLVAAFLSGDGVVTRFSEGPKVEEMEGVEEPQCNSALPRERAGKFQIPSLSSVTHRESCWNLVSEPGGGSLGTKRLRY